MTNKELQALRRVLFLSAKEASIHIAGHSTPRTWQKYEQGSVAIPNDVAQYMIKLNNARLNAIESIEQGLTNTTALSYYLSEAEYFANNRSGSVIDFRINQSIAAYFFSEGLVEIN